MLLPQSAEPGFDAGVTRREVETRAKVLADTLSSSIGHALQTRADTQRLSALQETVIGKLGDSVEMMTKIHEMTQPIQVQLEKKLAALPASEQDKAQEVLSHLTALDKLSSKAIVLGRDVANTDGPAKARAIAAMSAGMQAIAAEAQPHLGALIPGQALTSKLDTLQRRIAARLHTDLAHSGRNPRVALDRKLYRTVSRTARKIHALTTVARSASLQAKDEEERSAVREFAKAGMAHELVQMQHRVAVLKKAARAADYPGDERDPDDIPEQEEENPDSELEDEGVGEAVDAEKKEEEENPHRPQPKDDPWVGRDPETPGGAISEDPVENEPRWPNFIEIARDPRGEHGAERDHSDRNLRDGLH